jgi:hypothetical protein
MNMSRKQRTTIRRKNYRAWKQEHKQLSAQELGSRTKTHEVPSHAEQPNPSPGAGSSFDSDRPIDHVALLQQLRSPGISSPERLAVAFALEKYAIGLLFKPGDRDPDEADVISEEIRQDVRQTMREFGITDPLFDEAPPPPADSATVAPGHSTGPRTAAGLARSSQNARKHGLSSLISIFVMMPGEDPHEWVQLIDDLNQEFQPASRTERILVNDMAQSHWLTQRAINLQTSHIEDPKFFALYLRYQTTHHRAYYRALKQLLTLQKARTQSTTKPITVYPNLTAEHILTEPPPTQSGAGAPDPRCSPQRSVMPTSGTSNAENCLLQAA